MELTPYITKNVAFVLGAISVMHKLIIPTIACIILYTMMEVSIEMEKN